MEKIKITIKKDCSIEYEVKGVKGKGCKELTKFIDKLGNVIESKVTSEYHQAEDQKQMERLKS